MIQQGQVFELKQRTRQGEPLWAYRFRAAGRGSRRAQRGGFASEHDAVPRLSVSSIAFGESSESRGA